MTEDKTGDGWISRRNVLALVGTGIAALTSSSGVRITGPDTPRPPDGSRLSTAAETGRDRRDTADGDDDDGPGAEREQLPGENIEAYGAEPNPADPNVAAAKRNLTAFLDAATAAGDGGTVYVPAGVYYIGHDGVGPDPFTQFGSREPAGISIVGEGPVTSALAISEHTPAEEQPNQSGFMWVAGHDHGTITVEDVWLDGNYENLPNLVDTHGGSWGLQLNGTGGISLNNAYIRGWHLAGIRGRHMVESVTGCAFGQNGIGVHNDTNGNANSHHISIRPRAGDESLIERCHFIDCAGNAVNFTRNDGTLRMTDCYVTGTGSGLCKLSGGGLVEFKRIYHEANTDSLEQQVSERNDGINFHGRHLIKSLGERGESPVTLKTEHIESRDITAYALLARGGIGDGPPNVIWEGDMVAIHNANMTHGEEAIRDGAGGSYRDVAVDRLSVHGSGGDVFDTENSNGRIETLHRGNNAGGLGDPGNITIETDNEGGEPFLPDVPDVDEVGINTDAISIVVVRDDSYDDRRTNRSDSDDR